MATEMQIAANRANALHSTGPRTEAGKLASSHNAGKHNLTSRHLIILPGQEAAFDELESGLRDKLTPSGPLEEIIYKRIVECAWNMERCRMAELEILKFVACSAVDPLVNPNHHDRYERIHRYARQSENAMYKAMRELGKLQSEERLRQECNPTMVEPAGESTIAESLSPLVPLTHVLRGLALFRKTTQPAKPAVPEFLPAAAA